MGREGGEREGVMGKEWVRRTKIDNKSVVDREREACMRARARERKRKRENIDRRRSRPTVR